MVVYEIWVIEILLSIHPVKFELAVQANEILGKPPNLGLTEKYI